MPPGDLGELRLRPIHFKTAKEFVTEHHRHSVSTVGWKFGVGLEREGQLVGVGIAGRPVARCLDDGWTIEVLRVCVIEGVRNGCSMLYGALIRAAKALGYLLVFTYTLDTETGVSLRAAGWIQEAELPARTGWTTPSRERKDRGQDGVGRYRWRLPLSSELRSDSDGSH